ASSGVVAFRPFNKCAGMPASAKILEVDDLGSMLEPPVLDDESLSKLESEKYSSILMLLSEMWADHLRHGEEIAVLE
ncbi:hypothetical protein A2U01_0073629, partial [Trifolium medium]|nr:hypothetical protein [Trifolium medium]